MDVQDTVNAQQQQITEQISIGDMIRYQIGQKKYIEFLEELVANDKDIVMQHLHQQILDRERERVEKT